MDTLVFKEPPKITDERDVRIHHNSDWSGDAILQWRESSEDSVTQVRIPGWVARELCEACPKHPETP